MTGLPPKPRELWGSKKRHTQTLDDKIMFIQLHYVVESIYAMFICICKM